jgi:hypothetical protein
VIGFEFTLTPNNWELYSYGGPFSFNPGYVNLASNQVGTFSHPQKAN